MKVPPLAACALGVLTLGAAVSVAASCTYGVYDGHEGDAGDGVAIAFEPGRATRGKSQDGVFEIGLPADAFAVATTVRIARRADRETANVVVPSYEVTADVPLTGRASLAFTGNNGGGQQPSASFVVGRLNAEGVTPLPVAGRSNGTYWGIAQALGTFTLDMVELRGYRRSSNPTSCFERCCPAGGANDQGFATGRGCFCDQQNGSPGDVACLLACEDVSGDGVRCEERAAGQGTLLCPASGNPDSSATTQCPPQNASVQIAAVCCAGPASRAGDACSLTGCTGAVIRCASHENCANGYVCCAFDDEVRCSKTCPIERRVCTDASECAGAQVVDGGAACAKVAPRCPYGTCAGDVPAPCR